MLKVHAAHSVVWVALGAYGLFSGNTGTKEALWLVLPITVTIFIGVAVLCLISQDRLNWDSFKRILQDSIATHWTNESQSVLRLLRQLNAFSRTMAIVALVLICFYITTAVYYIDNYHCQPYTVGKIPPIFCEFCTPFVM